MTKTSHNGWKITGKSNGGHCQHCDRTLKHCYTITNASGATMTVGRGCLKTVTGWTIAQKEADRLVWLAERTVIRAANWAAFTAAHPKAATILDLTIEADGKYAPAASTIKHDISEGSVVGWELEHAQNLIGRILADA
jgi:hypothetical protein